MSRPGSCHEELADSRHRSIAKRTLVMLKASVPAGHETIY
jgi:hypothetical protein